MPLYLRRNRTISGGKRFTYWKATTGTGYSAIGGSRRLTKKRATNGSSGKKKRGRPRKKRGSK